MFCERNRLARSTGCPQWGSGGGRASVEAPCSGCLRAAAQGRGSADGQGLARPSLGFSLKSWGGVVSRNGQGNSEQIWPK